tara:strand:- start:176 stop:640 length:465 start_codon:yes stop_codon:yes gene_type:complete
MEVLIVLTYFTALCYNLILNFGQFHRINSCTSFEHYSAARQKKDYFSHGELLTSLYIIAFVGFTPMLFTKMSAFNKFLVVAYMLYLTYRFCASFLKAIGIRRELDLEEDFPGLKEELSIMDEMVNVKALLLLEPMFYVVLEGSFLLISVFIYFF